MALQFERNALAIELRSEFNGDLFSQARERHPTLARYATPAAILAVLGDASEDSWAEREAITRTLVLEHQERPQPLWAALLLNAFYPMLSRLRGRIYGHDLDAEDLDQLVVSTFLDVVRAFPLDERLGRTFMYLRQMTQRRVFQVLRQEHALRELVSDEDIDDALTFSAGEWPTVRDDAEPAPEPEDDADVVALLRARAGQLGQAQLDLVVATIVRGERLRTLVERTYKDRAPDERARIYQRLKRQRSRTLSRLRTLLADLRCPHSGDGGLCPSGLPEPPPTPGDFA